MPSCGTGSKPGRADHQLVWWGLHLPHHLSWPVRPRCGLELRMKSWGASEGRRIGPNTNSWSSGILSVGDSCDNWRSSGPPLRKRPLMGEHAWDRSRVHCMFSLVGWALGLVLFSSFNKNLCPKAVS